MLHADFPLCPPNTTGAYAAHSQGMPMVQAKAWQAQQPAYAEATDRVGNVPCNDEFVPAMMPPLSWPQVENVDGNSSADQQQYYQLYQQDEPQHMATSVLASSRRTSTSSSKKRSSRMTNSTRGKLYRSRRKKYTDGLADYVEELRKEVEDLQIYRRTQQETLYHSRNLEATSSFARIVCEYFSLFEFGVPVVAEGCNIPRDALLRSSRQASFLNSMMDPNIAFGGTHGVQLLLEQWERYSMYHTNLQLCLQNLAVVVTDRNPVISAKAVLRVRFSRFTIQKVFPHVLWNEALVQRLIGLEIDYPVGNTFYFGDDGKIHGYETEVDFIDAFTRALGSIQDSVELVCHALIKKQHMIGEVEEQEEENVALESSDDVSNEHYQANLREHPVYQNPPIY